ncbi:MAG: DUF3108 domain-containing protein [Chloroflexota bacterium]
MLNKIIRSAALLALLTFVCASQSFAAGVFYPGEELEYEVSFLGVKLGSIKMYSERVETMDGKKTYKSKALIDSYKGIPFVDLHAVFESWMDPSLAFSHKFAGNQKVDDKTWAYQKFYFDYSKGVIKNQKWLNRELVYENDLKFANKCNDGNSLFFFARQYVDSKKSAKAPTIVDKEVGYTYINFYGKREKVEIDAIDYPVRTIYFDGRIDWQGVYGLKGKFQGWFSDDEARIPIKAKMNVYVGNVVIELVKWKRPGWTPPKG